MFGLTHGPGAIGSNQARRRLRAAISGASSPLSVAPTAALSMAERRMTMNDDPRRWPSNWNRLLPIRLPFYARLTNRKNNACLETGSDRAAIDAIWCSLSGVNSRANCTFSSSCAIESQPIITVLTGCESE